jgi:hypothetical protein
MDLVISYTSVDREKLRPLLEGLHRLRYQVWFDQELSGGQEWWDAILGRIRSCDALLLALTPAVIDSEACAREMAYARAVGKPILPVMIERVRPELLPSHLASVQIVDFTDPAGSAAFDLTGALLQLPAPLPLPDPLPPEPAVPISYLSDLSERIQAANMNLDEQLSLVGRLRQGLAKPRERDAVLELVQRLKQRNDLYQATAQELELMTAAAVAKEATPPASPAAAGATSDRATHPPASAQAASGPATVAPPAVPAPAPAAPAPVPAAPAPPAYAPAPPAYAPAPAAYAPAPAAYAPAPAAYVPPRAPAAGYGQYSPAGSNFRPPPAKNSNLVFWIVGAVVAILILGGTTMAIAIGIAANKSAPNPAATHGTVLAVGDACVVGSWVLRNAAGQATDSSGTLTTSGGDGAALTISKDGALVEDFTNSKPLIGVFSTGEQVTDQFEGVYKASVHAGPNGAWKETQLSNTVMQTISANGTTEPQTGVVMSPAQSYNCTSSQLVLITEGETDTYGKP